MDVLKVILTSFLSAASLFIIAKITGHKQMSQLDLFDYVTGITIGSIAAEMATELENPLKPFVAMVVYGAVTVFLTTVTSKLPKLRKYVNGTPTVIISGGVIYRENMKKAKLDLSELMVMCRQEGYFNLSDIDTAVFEYNGRLTVLPKAQKRPATLKDLHIVPEAESLNAEVIMDGRIMGENLGRMGLDEAWLKSELKSRGYGSEKDIFLCLCNQNKELTFFPMTQ